MRKLLSIALLLCLVCAAVLGLAGSALAEHDKEWADLVTGIDANGNIVTTKVFGYYADVGGLGRVFVVCDPSTGKETGDALIPGVKVGEKATQKVVRYDIKEGLDWDRPKQVNPVRLALVAPNIPTGTQYDWEYYKQTGQLVKKAVNQFAWPMSYSFARMIPGSDPNYWLIVALVENSNPFAVTANVQARIYEWQTGGYSGGAGPASFEGAVSLGPHETKYVLLSNAQKSKFLADELWKDWPDVGYSDAYYYTGVTAVNDPEYPDMLRSGNQQGFFVPYVRWDGTNPTVNPLIPMRLAFNFGCSGEDYAGHWRWGSQDPEDGRGWYNTWGHAEYDPTTEQWSVSVRVDPDYRRPWWSYQQWNNFVQKFQSNATTALKEVFSKWYPKVPFLDAWGDESLYVDGDTGYYCKSWPNGRKPDFVISFSYLEPVPPSNAPPAYPPSWWWANIRWGGWLYTTGGPRSHGSELTAPILFRYGYDVSNPIWEGNYRSYSVTSHGETDTVYAPRGTGIQRNHTDVRYFDLDWMDIVPVVQARPMFIDQYRFIATDGNFGYLKKDTVPGYLLWIDTYDRPILNVVTQPVEVRATWYRYGGVDASGVFYVCRKWLWTPSGWQFQGESVDRTRRSLSGDKSVWTLSFMYNHTVNGNNPTDFPAAFTGIYGGTPSLYWSGSDVFKARVASMADTIKKGHYDYSKDRYVVDGYVPQVDYLNCDPIIPFSGVPTLAPDESKWLLTSSRNADTQFWASRRSGRPYYESWETFENRMLNEIATNVIQPVFASQEEAVFNGGGKFVMTPTFKAGQGGIVSGAQKVIIHQRLRWSSKWDDYIWCDLDDDIIGFQGAGITLCSYVSSASPTGGLVVKGGDEYLGRLLRDKYAEIPFNSWVPASQRQWRFYSNGVVYPPPYPEG
ncbi:MAG: hypothetical protein QME76_07230 [Bacillota bacterium]|nr:hypothetical protein [Bacillota bacterium]